MNTSGYGRLPNTKATHDTCRDCDSPIELVNGEWVDAVGVGCPGCGESGEVLPHRPRLIEVAPDTFKRVRVDVRAVTDTTTDGTDS